ncbi:hypothetical protein IW967_14705 [Alicyclobacillus mali]|uniref:DUF5667 domain-containing protein n=1 Tax=Alicyclobacillus mali (ex Roth et al. 2021) TaxID=1123961 RepID=A0ABS0F756_9BACL|nr:hypothetical protein [Alicyclobacillus mali (ex Roth et al. 2021)]MBF8379098.1 hypothetical protein [Alicyclobacillus mali (ex Roth et al. 2021)]MCL6488604.1 hypothetical protein [Alicyclobacillus mali (ex Roth et al. 2021)]
MNRGLFLAIAASVSLLSFTGAPVAQAYTTPAAVLLAVANTTGNGTDGAPAGNGTRPNIHQIITQFEQAIAPYENIHPTQISHPPLPTQSLPTSPEAIDQALQQTLQSYKQATQSDKQAQAQLQAAVNAYIDALQLFVQVGDLDILTQQTPDSTAVVSYLEDALYTQAQVSADFQLLQQAHAAGDNSELLAALLDMTQLEQQKVSDLKTATKILAKMTGTLQAGLSS